jgi:hypothetical protein
LIQAWELWKAGTPFKLMDPMFCNIDEENKGYTICLGGLIFAALDLKPLKRG